MIKHKVNTESSEKDRYAMKTYVFRVVVEPDEDRWVAYREHS